MNIIKSLRLIVLCLCCYHSYLFGNAKGFVKHTNQELGVTFYQWRTSANNISANNKLYRVLPSYTDCVVLAGGMSTGKTTILSNLANDMVFLSKLQNYLTQSYNDHLFSVVFLEECAVKIVSRWQLLPSSNTKLYNNKLDEMVKKLSQNDSSLNAEFQQEIMDLQLQQLKVIPQEGRILVIADRSPYDGIGYCVMNNVDQRYITNMHNSLKNYPAIKKVFLFDKYIKDDSNKTDRIENNNEVEKNCIELSTFIRKIYRANVASDRIEENLPLDLLPRLSYIKEKIYELFYTTK